MISCYSRSCLKQTAIVSALNFGQFNIGLTLGYSAISIPQLKAQFHPTEFQIAAIASCICMGQILGSIISAFVSHRFGRKPSVLFSNLFQIMGWALICWGRSVEMVIVGRLSTGIGSGIEGSIHCLYVSEIVSTKWRGPFVSSGNFIIALGILGVFFVGSFSTWKTAALACGLVSVFSLIVQLFIPESPHWLKQRLKADTARSIIQTLGIPIEELESGNIDSDKKELNQDPFHRRCLKFRFMKPLGILIFAFWTQSWSGFICILAYAVTIMNETGVAMNEYHATLTLGLTHLIGSGLGILALHRFKRRTLLLVSTALSSLACICLFLEDFVNEEHDPWIPYLLILAFILVYANGLGSVPWVIVGELFPVDVSAFGVGLTTCIAYAFMFFAVQSFPWMKRMFGLHYVFLIYGLISSFGGAMMYFMVPETKGLHLDEIEKMMNISHDKNPENEDEEVGEKDIIPSPSGINNRAFIKD